MNCAIVPYLKQQAASSKQLVAAHKRWPNVRTGNTVREASSFFVLVLFFFFDCSGNVSIPVGPTSSVFVIVVVVVVVTRLPPPLSLSIMAEADAAFFIRLPSPPPPPALALADGKRSLEEELVGRSPEAEGSRNFGWGSDNRKFGDIGGDLGSYQ